MMTIVDNTEPSVLLDAVHKATHFGPNGHPGGQQIPLPTALSDSILGNYYLNSSISIAQEHMGTQGDGNHFAYAGTLETTGQTVLVTHQGSRAVGARLYTRGMKVAEKNRLQIRPETHKANAWIPLDSQQGEDYRGALQIVRQ